MGRGCQRAQIILSSLEYLSILIINNLSLNEKRPVFRHFKEPLFIFFEKVIFKHAKKVRQSQLKNNIIYIILKYEANLTLLVKTENGGGFPH